ncbi:MAG: hypothetical protein COA82_03500 [Alkaliphilus sp.]|nr:MAG: hypothetical protein COA82_03500 [Alkaliphilus sp.]
MSDKNLKETLQQEMHGKFVAFMELTDKRLATNLEMKKLIFAFIEKQEKVTSHDTVNYKRQADFNKDLERFIVEVNLHFASLKEVRVAKNLEFHAQNVINTEQSKMNKNQDEMIDAVKQMTDNNKKIIYCILAGFTLFMICACANLMGVHHRLDLIEEASIEAFTEQHQRIEKNRQDVKLHDGRLNLFLNEVDDKD